MAPELLGKLLVRGGLAARIVEVEAYCGAEDAGSHAFRGMTRRNATMFGPPGHLYVYFTYGMHWCANAVCGREGEGVAVLLRAAEPVAGLEVMRGSPAPRRGATATCSPVRPACARPSALTGAEDGADLVTADHGVALVDDGTPPPEAPAVSTRIGLTVGTEHPWRWCTPGSLHLSKPA